MRLERPERVEAGDGEASLVFHPEGTVWVALAQPGFSERVTGERLSSRVTHRARMRAGPAVAAGWRLVDGQSAFTVVSAGRGQRRGETELLLKEDEE
ncbi:head-tail adaptor protein [Stappia sp. F7233]|uniref:Head-tail adaptor protein n=1 Tax=Stappia albiluteola TaxID=2758565 RepID=A0A839A9Y1_9HYPH|nr:head-tail adaptor protein [Stappia albiluteola]MBA5776363.1 head-tail adaptor protein [Stappia albiluteola]